MKTILIISILAFGIILVGCSQKGLSDSELFTKKTECAKYITNAEKWEEKYYIDDNDMHQYSKINSIFYSPVLNTCLYEGSTSIRFNNENGVREHNLSLYINDALTYESVFSISFGQFGYPHSEYSKHSTTFNNKIQELKGE